MSKTTTQPTKPAGDSVQRLVRAPLARGRIYQFNGYPTKIKINAVAFRGHPEDDGGLEGVSVTWINSSHPRMWYPCKSDDEFWSMLIFSNAYDSPNQGS